MMKTKAPALTMSERNLAIAASRAGNRHDRRRHQCPNRNRGESDADEPGRKSGEDQSGDGEVGTERRKSVMEGGHFVDPPGCGHEAEQSEEAEQKGVGGKDRSVAPDHLPRG
jgi:hypothetical protein